MILLSVLISFVATVLGAISGIGGGVIIKPVMDALSGLPVAQISFLSGCTVLAMSIVTLLRSFGDSVRVEPRRGTLLAVGGAVGGVIGKQIFDAALVLSPGSSGVVGVVQNAMMCLLTAGVLVYMLHKANIQTKTIQNSVACIGIGFMLGLISSFLGIGGGPINLVVLYFFFSMDTKSAALHSLYIILFSQAASLASTFISGRVPSVELSLLCAMAVSGIAGGFVGRSLNKKMSTPQVDLLFRIMLIAIMGISVYNLSVYIRLL